MPIIYKYELEVSDGTLGWTHGWTSTITEFWMPEHNLCFNIYGEQINIMEEENPRDADIVEVEVGQHIVNLVLTMRETKRTLKPALEELYDSLSETVKEGGEE